MYYIIKFKKKNLKNVIYSNRFFKIKLNSYKCKFNFLNIKNNCISNTTKNLDKNNVINFK